MRIREPIFTVSKINFINNYDGKIKAVVSIKEIKERSMEVVKEYINYIKNKILRNQEVTKKIEGNKWHYSKYLLIRLLNIKPWCPKIVYIFF